jgi:hypothetical protein
MDLTVDYSPMYFDRRNHKEFNRLDFDVKEPVIDVQKSLLGRSFFGKSNNLNIES